MAITVSSSGIRPLRGAQARRITLATAMLAGVIVAINSLARGVKATNATSALEAYGRGVALANNTGGTAFQVGERIDMVFHGPVSGFSGLEPGKPVYVDADGAYTHTLPGAGKFVHEIGYAESDQILFVAPTSQLPRAGS